MDYRDIFKKYLLVAGVLCIAFAVSLILTKYFFIQNSPTFNSDFLATMRTDLMSLLPFTDNTVREIPLTEEEKKEVAANTEKVMSLAQDPDAFKQISHGVYAAENDSGIYYRLNNDGASLVTKEFKVGNGTVTLKCKEGYAPSKEMLEMLQKYAK